MVTAQGEGALRARGALMRSMDLLLQKFFAYSIGTGEEGLHGRERVEPVYGTNSSGVPSVTRWRRFLGPINIGSGLTTQRARKTEYLSLDNVFD